MWKIEKESLSMIAAIPVGVTTGSFLSSDGTLMGYRQMGKGPGLVLLHGALQSSRSFTSLGAALSDAFTIYIPDRRGRGLSGPFGDNHSMRTETEDLEALLDKTGSHHVFALSAGALVALQCALESPAIHRLAIYEPPLEIGRRPSPLDWVPRYDKELAAGNLAAAMAAAIKGTGDREFFTNLPSFILAAIFKLAMRYQRRSTMSRRCKHSFQRCISTPDWSRKWQAGSRVSELFVPKHCCSAVQKVRCIWLPPLMPSVQSSRIADALNFRGSAISRRTIMASLCVWQTSCGAIFPDRSSASC